MNQPDFSRPASSAKQGAGPLRVGVYLNPASPDAGQILQYFHQQGISVSSQEAHLMISRLRALAGGPAKKKPVPQAEEEGSTEMQKLMRSLLAEVRKELARRPVDNSAKSKPAPEPDADPFAGFSLPPVKRQRRR